MSDLAAADRARLQDRRAIEALRAGVPNRDAVRALGAAQPRVEERFREQLSLAREGAAIRAQTPGLLVAGDFGSGKSHLLEYLQHLALEEHFVCSKVVISKETPLHDPARLFRAAVQSAIVPDKKGTALVEIAGGLKVGSPGYTGLAAWVNSADSGLSSRFAATMFLFGLVNDPEIRERIISFWSGDPLSVSELRGWLRAYREVATYRLESVPAKELPLQRFRFVPRLMTAAGYAGWVLLVDEVELIGRYSFMQRARSYSDLARLAGRLEQEAFPGLTTVFAITSDFAAAVLEQRNDAELIPARLRSSGLPAEQLLASRAERGMRLISHEATPLRPLEPAAIEHTREHVRAIHARAYRWQPTDLPLGRVDASTRLRTYVRRWINELDLHRLYPGYVAETVVADLRVDYTESPALETPTEGSSEAEPKSSTPTGGGARGADPVP